MKSPATLSCFVALAALGCSSRPVSRASNAVPATSHSTLVGAPVPESSSTPSPAPSSTPSEAPPALSAEESEIAAMLSDVCQVAYSDVGVGCACCPPFDGCKPHEPSSALDQRAYRPMAVTSGSFTRPGADERAVSMEGCASHAENGGMLVLERTPSGFVLSRYVSGLIGYECWPVRRDDARDLLLCALGDVHQGHTQVMFFQWDLAAEDAQLLEAEPLVSVDDDASAACVGELGDEVSSSLVRASRLVSREGRPGLELEIDLDVRQGKITPAYSARCRELEALDEPVPEARWPRMLLRGHTEKLVFRFDGKGFVTGRRRP